MTVGQEIFARQTDKVSPLSLGDEVSVGAACRSICDHCGGRLIEIRMKLVCRDCHAICETCCEGGRA